MSRSISFQNYALALKKLTNVDIHTVHCIKKGQILFCREKNLWFEQKSYMKLILSRLLEFGLTKNIFVILCRYVFSTESTNNCPSVLADLFLYSYEADLSQKCFKKGDKKTTRCFNFTFRQINDVLSR